MPKATISNGDLVNLADCYIFVPNFGPILIHALPDISDSKSAAYNDEPIIGRAFPLKTYSHSENRSISMQLHLHARKKSDLFNNLRVLRAVQSCVYPRDDNTGNSPFIPPVVCRIKCGKLLADNELCVVLKNYSVKFPTDVPWDEGTYTPWKFDIDTTWEVVYKSSELPGQDRIMNLGS